ncbi:MAG: hypothetical protein JWM91_2168 [Rhodospirillales bacterium]|nr:hypothetical protein [Rhodospirillales bacterium]
MNHVMSRGIFTSIAISLVAFSAGPARAVCMQPQPVRVCTEFFHSENVIVAKILSVRKIPDTPDPNNVEGWFYRIAVDKSLRGGTLPTDEIYTGNDETKFTMEVGKSYLLFINKNQQLRAAPDSCGNSSELSKAKSSIMAIDAILKAAASGGGGDIGGRVMLPVAGSQAMSDAGAPGVPLVVKNYVGRDQTVSTDERGHFDIHVPAGHYTVEGASEAWEMMPYALSYMKPADFELPDGSCADLVFLAQPK